MMLAVALMALCATTVSGNISSELQRLNYGIVFEPKAELHLAEETWVHTFEIELPTGISMIDLPGCVKDEKSCLLVNDVLLEVNQIRHTTEIMINNTIETINKLIPVRQLGIRSRSKRALLSFIGDLSKSIFGTATVKDVEMLASHINALNKITSKVVSTVEQHEENLASYIQASDERMSNIMEGLKANELAIQHIQNELYNSFDNLERAFTTTNVFLAEHIEKSRKIENRFKEILEGVFDLVEGKLSPHLIQAKTISKTVKDIQTILHNKFNGFHLVFTDTNDIYQNVQTIYARKGSKLYVALKFPIVPFQKPLSLFSVHSFSVPVNDSTNHATHLLNLPELFAVTHDYQFYVTFNQKDLVNCKTFSSKLLCNFNKILTPVTTKTCILGVFQNDKTIVKQKCDFRFIVDHINPNIVVLSKTNIVVYKIDTLEFMCNSSKHMVNGCNFCTMTVPCQCSVTAKDLYLPQRLSDCQESTISKLHPINLAVLQQFFNDTSLQAIDSKTLFKNPLNVEVPHFRLYNHSMSQIITDDRKSHLSLQKMAEAAKKDAMAFRTLTEPLLAGHISVENSWPTTDDILLYCTTAVAGLCLFLLIFVFLKLRKLLILITLLKSTHLQQVSASTVPSFIYKQNKPINTEESNFFDKLDLELDHYILALSVCTFLFIVSVTFYLLHLRRQKNALVVELTNGQHCVRVPLITLSLCPNYWQAHIPQTIDSISIRGLWYPILSFDWDRCHLKNNLTGKSLMVNKQTHVSLVVSKKIRKILNSTYCVYFYFQHGNVLIPLENHLPQMS